MKAMYVGFLSLLLLATSVSAVSFNGPFLNGTTLYSDVEHYEHVIISGRDAYPVGGSPTRVRECTTEYRENRKRVCERVIKSYRDKRVKSCDRILVDGRRRTVCSYETIQVPRYGRSCSRVIVGTPYERCRTRTVTHERILCEGSNGERSNRLGLDQFYYNYEGNWIQMSSRPITLFDVNLRFRVDIPTVCSPSYDIDKAIKLSGVDCTSHLEPPVDAQAYIECIQSFE